MVLLTYLPIDKSAFYGPMYSAILNDEEYTPEYSDTSNEPPKNWWKKELDRIRGRNRPRDTIGLDEFMKDMSKRR